MQSGEMRVEGEQVFVWSESDMTAAIFLFIKISAWNQSGLAYQAVGRPVTKSLAFELCLELPEKELIYPAMAVTAMGWPVASVCGALQHLHRNLFFLPPPSESGSTPTEKSGAMHRCQQHGPGAAVYIDGISQGELRDLTSLAAL